MNGVTTVERWQLLRLLDANLNRATEGLRTLEDVCRLVYEQSECAARSKALRHRLAEVGQAVPRWERLAARNTASDAGTGASTAGEQTRESWEGIVAASCERILQALRSLEEFSKFEQPALAAEFKTLRYVAYDELANIELILTGHPHASRDVLRPNEAAGLRAAEAATERLHLSRLYLLIGCERPLAEFTSLLVELAEAGVDCFQLRDKRAEAQTLMQYTTAAMRCLEHSQALFFVNDRIDIAVASGADGVHLGQEDIALSVARRLVGQRLLIGISTHDREQAELALRGGADYIGCGPTFPSSTKEFAQFAGPAFLAEVSRVIPLPAFAIGGIAAANVQQVIDAGVGRIAVSQAILGSASPAEAAAELSRRLKASPIQ
jgi:thiamine-phosphate pyrophosphorylase